MSLSSLKEKEKWGFSDASGLNSSLNLSCELINLSCTLDDKTPTVRNFLSHADLTVPAHQVQTGCLSGQDAEIWEVRRRRRGGWHQRNAVLPSDCFCVCDCLCVMHEQNMQSDQNSSAWHGTYSVNGADPDSFSVFFFCKYSRKYRPLFMFSLCLTCLIPRCLNHSHSSSVSLGGPEQQHLSSLSPSPFSLVLL